jgi:hypothetical protein
MGPPVVYLVFRSSGAAGAGLAEPCRIVHRYFSRWCSNSEGSNTCHGLLQQAHHPHRIRSPAPAIRPVAPGDCPAARTVPRDVHRRPATQPAPPKPDSSRRRRVPAAHRGGRNRQASGPATARLRHRRRWRAGVGRAILAFWCSNTKSHWCPGTPCGVKMGRCGLAAGGGRWRSLAGASGFARVSGSPRPARRSRPSARRAPRSGQGPGSFGASEAVTEQGAEVDRGAPGVQPAARHSRSTASR